MGITGDPDIFQSTILGLLAQFEFVCVYLDDLLKLTKINFSNHLQKLNIVLKRL